MMNLLITFLIFTLLIITKYTKLIYDCEFNNIVSFENKIFNNNLNLLNKNPNINCKCTKYTSLIKNNYCKKCFCYFKDTPKNNLYYINSKQNLIKELLINYITKIIHSFIYQVINLFKFFIEFFILFLYDTFIFIFFQYPLTLVSVRLIC